MIKKFINWIKGLFSQKKPVVEEGPREIAVVVTTTPQHCPAHIRFRKNCLECLRVVGLI